MSGNIHRKCHKQDAKPSQDTGRKDEKNNDKTNATYMATNKEEW